MGSLSNKDRPRASSFLGPSRGLHDLTRVKHLLCLDGSLVVRRLRAVFAILGAAAGLDGEESALLDLEGIEVGSVDLGLQCAGGREVLEKNWMLCISRVILDLCQSQSAAIFLSTFLQISLLPSSHRIISFRNPTYTALTQNIPIRALTPKYNKSMKGES